jgi:hypothetical protein
MPERRVAAAIKVPPAVLGLDAYRLWGRGMPLNAITPHHSQRFIDLVLESV